MASQSNTESEVGSTGLTKYSSTLPFTEAEHNHRTIPDPKLTFDPTRIARLVVASVINRTRSVCGFVLVLVFCSFGGSVSRRSGLQGRGTTERESRPNNLVQNPGFELTLEDEKTPLDWRQGIKHDAARVMEVRAPVEVESGHLYPLLKSSDLHHGRPPGRHLVVPQRALDDDTGALARTAPRLWRYLLAHADVLDARRSSIYRGRARFSVFGVGPYAFAPYKVAVSGMHPVPAFRVVGPVGGRPVVFDDTCYFLPFTEAGEAATTAAVLAATPARELLTALTYRGAKRPVTKSVLTRLDLRVLARLADPAELAERRANFTADLLRGEDVKH